MLKVEIDNQGQAIITIDGDVIQNLRDIRVLDQVRNTVLSEAKRKMTEQYIEKCGKNNMNEVSKLIDTSLQDILKLINVMAIVKMT